MAGTAGTDTELEDGVEAARDVESDVEELGDPEAAPTNPAGVLAALSGIRGRARAVLAGRAGGGTITEIWGLAWPVMLSQVLANMVSLVDVAMVGRLGAVDQAAVGYAAQLFFLVQATLFAIGFASVALMARAIGAGHPERSRRAMAAALVLSLAVAGVLAGGVALFARPILGLLNAAPEVVTLCIPYLRLLMASSLLLAVALTLESSMRADRDTKTPMRITIVVTAVKVAGNVLLIFGVAGFPRLELVGAGLATLISQAVAVVLFAVVLARRPAAAPTALRAHDLSGIGRLMPSLVRIAIPGIGERLVMNLAMLSYFSFLGTYGTVAAATYTIGIRILSFSWIPGTGYSQGVATLVAQSLGAQDAAGADRTAWRAVRLALATALVMGTLAALAREPLARFFTVDPDTILALGPFLLCLALAQPAMQLHFTLAGAFRGSGDTFTPLVGAAIGNWVFRVPLAWLAASVFHAPLVWIWSVLIFDHIARASWLLFRLRAGALRRRAVALPA